MLGLSEDHLNVYKIFTIKDLMGRKLSGGRPFLKVVLNLCYGLLSVFCPQLLSQGTRLQPTPASVNCIVHSLPWWIKIREALSQNKPSLLQVLVMYSVRGTRKVTNTECLL